MSNPIFFARIRYNVFTALACLTGGLSSFAQTPPPQAAGYSLVFSDDFASLNLSPTGVGSYTWYPGVWFETTMPPQSAISAGNSVLDLAWTSNGGMNDTSIEGFARDGSAGNAFRYGYFEASMKWDVVTGAWPQFWMIPKQGINGVQQHTGEIDIFEGQGGDPHAYFGTLHEWNGQTELWTNSPNNRYPLPANTDFSQWHKYGLLWIPGQVTWYFDDQAVSTLQTTAIFDQQDYFIVLSSQEGANWTTGSTAGVTANSINLNVDWVHVWQSQGVAAAQVKAK